MTLLISFVMCNKFCNDSNIRQSEHSFDSTIRVRFPDHASKTLEENVIKTNIVSESSFEHI